VLGGLGSWRRRGDDDVHLEPNEFGRQRGQLIFPARRPPVVGGDVLSFDPAQFP
jgi:hypothetical protein